MSTQYWQSKQAGVCFICQKRPRWGERSACKDCAIEQRLKQRARVADAKANGRCTKCFERPKAEESRWCIECVERHELLQNPATREAELARRPLRQWHSHKNGHRQETPGSLSLFDVTQKTLFD